MIKDYKVRLSATYIIPAPDEYEAEQQARAVFNIVDLEADVKEEKKVALCSECGGELRELTEEEILARELLDGAHICSKCGFTFGLGAVEELTQ